MGLRAEYSLGQSEFNAFLFAYVDEDKSGQGLTVLSALARLGIDPWQEAARLSELPQEAARSALSDSLARLPESDWKASESRSIATRLIDCLPRRTPSATSSEDSSGAQQQQQQQRSGPRGQAWLVWIAFAALLVAVFWQQTG